MDQHFPKSVVSQRESAHAPTFLTCRLRMLTVASYSHGLGREQWSSLKFVTTLAFKLSRHVIHPDTSTPAHSSYIFAHSFSRVIGGDPAEAGPQMAALWDPLRPFWDIKGKSQGRRCHHVTCFQQLLCDHYYLWATTKLQPCKFQSTVYVNHLKRCNICTCCFLFAGGTGPLWIPMPTNLFHKGGSEDWSSSCTSIDFVMVMQLCLVTPDFLCWNAVVSHL